MNIIPRIIKYKYMSFNERKMYENWIFQNLQTNKIKKVRKDLYALVDPSSGYIYANKYEIASNISESSFLSYHSALEFYGLANQVFNELTISSKTKFNDFEFEDVSYNYKSTMDDYQVIYDELTNVRVTTIERTVIDCIDRIDLAGGLEELYKALSVIRKLHEDKLIDALVHINKDVLWKKTGFILSLFNDNLKLNTSFFDECLSHVKDKKNYLLESSDNIYSSKWKLYVPSKFKSAFGGIFNEYIENVY